MDYGLSNLTRFNQFPGLVKNSKFNQICYPYWLKKTILIVQLLAHLWLSSICVHEYIWKNVWTSDKRWEPGTLSHSHMLSIFHSLIQSLSTCWTTFVFMSMLKSHSLSFTLSHSHTLTLSSHSFTHSWHAEQLLFSSLCWKLTLTLSLNLTLFQSLIHSLLTCWTTFVSCLCSNVTVYSRKLQWFLAGNQLYEL